MDARNTILDALDALRLTAEGEAIGPILKDLNSYFINLDRVIESLMPLTQDNARLRPIVKMYTLKECQEDYIIGEYKIWVVSAECIEDIYENKIDVHDGDTIPNDNRYKELCLRIGHSKTDVYAFSRLLFFNKPYQENGVYYVRNEFARFSGYIQNLIYSKLSRICELLNAISESMTKMYDKEKEEQNPRRRQIRKKEELRFEDLLKSTARKDASLIHYHLERVLKGADTKTVGNTINILIYTDKMPVPHELKCTAYLRLFIREFGANCNTTPANLRKYIGRNFQDVSERVKKIVLNDPYKGLYSALRNM